MPDCLTKEERDRKLVQIAHSYTDLTEADIQILLTLKHLAHGPAIISLIRLSPQRMNSRPF